ncbi:MAG: DUF4870 domain-containing protein [Verrucomicrobiota bacterium]
MNEEESNEKPAVPESQGEVSATAAADGPSSEEKTMAMLTHLLAFSGYFTVIGTIVGPLILWVLKRDTMPFVDDQGKEAVNFNISFFIYYVIAGILCATIIFLIIGVPAFAILFILHVVFIIVAAIKASNGEAYRYPMTIRFIK